MQVGKAEVLDGSITAIQVYFEQHKKDVHLIISTSLVSTNDIQSLKGNNSNKNVGTTLTFELDQGYPESQLCYKFNLNKICNNL